MKPKTPVVKLRQTVIGVTLLLAAFGSSALSLGRPRGAVVIGQPLDVSIPVRVDAGDDTSAQCYEADVFHADTRVNGSRVSVTIEPGATPQDMTVRVRSATIVDEPIVSIYLRAGCLQRSTRRYVLLADIASEAVLPPALPSVGGQPVQAGTSPQAPGVARGGAGATPATGGTRADGGQGRAGAGRATGSSANAAQPGADTAPTMAAAERRRQRRADAQSTRADGAPASAAAAPAVAAAPPAARDSIVKRRPEPAAGRSRLKLDPIDLTVEVDPVLRSSSELRTPVTEDLKARAEAAALWRALNAQPLDILRDTQRLQALEADVRALRDATAKSQASLADVRAQLQKAEGERYANVLVYSLAGLLVAALALAVFLWLRARDAARAGEVWWNNRGVDGAAVGIEPSGASSGGKASLTEVDVDLGMDENLFASLKSRTVPPAPAPAPVPLPRFIRSQPDHSDFSSSLPGMGSRAVNAEELFDIQQQADFFVSLGQYDQAIEVLKNHIGDNVETSALAYLDLLKIYHTLERRDDYNALRDDFNRVFNAQVPEFDSYTVESNGLETYGTAMSRIEALWPSAKVLEVIEESIFRKPGTGDGEAFDLEAYRELLLLYAMAKDVVDRRTDSMDFEASGPPSMPPDSGDSRSRRGGKFSATAIQPLSAVNHDDTLPEIPMPKASPRLGLDIDLTEPGPLSAVFGGPEDEHQKTDFDLGDFHSESIMEDIDSLGESRREDPREEAGHSDGHMIDFDLFDPATEAEIAPKPVIKSPNKPGRR